MATWLQALMNTARGLQSQEAAPQGTGWGPVLQNEAIRNAQNYWKTPAEIPALSAQNYGPEWGPYMSGAGTPPIVPGENPPNYYEVLRKFLQGGRFDPMQQQAGIDPSGLPPMAQSIDVVGEPMPEAPAAQAQSPYPYPKLLEMVQQYGKTVPEPTTISGAVFPGLAAAHPRIAGALEGGLIGGSAIGQGIDPLTAFLKYKTGLAAERAGMPAAQQAAGIKTVDDLTKIQLAQAQAENQMHQANEPYAAPAVPALQHISGVDAQGNPAIAFLNPRGGPPINPYNMQPYAPGEFSPRATNVQEPQWERYNALAVKVAQGTATPEERSEYAAMEKWRAMGQPQILTGQTPEGEPSIFRVPRLSGPAERVPGMEPTPKVTADPAASEKVLAITDDLDRLEGIAQQLLTHPGRSSVTGTSRMFTGLTRYAPGTAARDFEAKLEALKAQVGFNALQKMRELSKTGGAVGQVSNYEQELFQQQIDSLDPSQSDKQFLRALQNVITFAEDSKRRLRSALGAVPAGQGPPSSPAAPSTPIAPPTPPRPPGVPVDARWDGQYWVK